MDNNYLYQIHVSNNSYEKDVLWELDVLKETIKESIKKHFGFQLNLEVNLGHPQKNFFNVLYIQEILI